MQSSLDAPLDVASLAARAGSASAPSTANSLPRPERRRRTSSGPARLDTARMLLSRGLLLRSVAAQVGLFPPARLTEAFERRFGIKPRLFRDMHAAL